MDAVVGVVMSTMCKPKLPSVKDRGEVVLPEEGRLTFVELALNSRCTSDYDDNSHRFHWGLFDRQNTWKDNIRIFKA